MQEKIHESIPPAWLEKEGVNVDVNKPVKPDEVRALFASVNWKEESQWSDEMINSGFNNALCLVTARDREGKLISMSRAITDGIYIFFLNFVTEPQYQKRHLGSHLFTTLVNESVKRFPNYSSLVGFVTNPPEKVLTLYRNLGLQIIPDMRIIASKSSF